MAGGAQQLSAAQRSMTQDLWLMLSDKSADLLKESTEMP